MASKHSIDLTKGSVMKKLLVFALPIMLTNVLHQLYHMADVVVVGNFAQKPTLALAAVGSTGAVTNLFLNLFIGLSVGLNVVCANHYGAREKDDLRKAMHTGVTIGAVGGVIISIIGFIFARTLLEWMGSPADVIDQATIYVRTLFLGQPANLLFNFGAGILRAHGDTKRPMYILFTSGFLNVLLNMLFVMVFHLDAMGVALATAISYYISAASVLVILFHPGGEYHLSSNELKVTKKEAVKIVKIGIPCGLNGIVFNLTNIIITTALNSLGSVTLAANSAAANVDAVLYQVQASFYSACVSFAGQNYGAKDFKRIDKLLGRSILLAAGTLLFIEVFLFAKPTFFMHLFTQDSNVAKIGAARLMILGAGYVIHVVSEMAIGCMRGMGKSMAPLVLNAVCISVPRFIWVLLVFPFSRTYWFLLLCYPISWVFSSTAQLICYFYYRKKEERLYLEAMEKATESLAQDAV